MKSYPSYKDTGVEWIGEIPSSWDTNKVKYLFKEKKSVRNTNLNSGSISFGKVVYKDDEKIPKSTKESYQEVLNGEFLINPLNLNFDLKSLRISKSEINVVVSQGYIVLNIIEIQYSDYFTYLLREFDVKHMKSLGQGVRQTISFNHISNEILLIPPVTEQNQISKFLDTKTQKIDELIEKTEQKIKLLKEKRTSLINHCVTKGLNPNVEMKDSGVEWIGEIPIHYDIVRLKFLCSVKTGSRDTQDKVEDGDYPFYVRSPNIERINSYSFDGESVLTVGDGVGTGKVFHYVNGKFEFHQRVYKFSDFKRITGKFFYWFMKHHFIFVTEDQNSKSTVDSLRRPLINGFQFVIPSIEEQTQIVEYLDEHTKKIDSTIEKETQRTELLKEYRQSLISEVVTGKIDVRDYNG